MRSKTKSLKKRKKNDKKLLMFYLSFLLFIIFTLSINFIKYDKSIVTSTVGNMKFVLVDFSNKAEVNNLNKYSNVNVAKYDEYVNYINNNKTTKLDYETVLITDISNVSNEKVTLDKYGNKKTFIINSVGFIYLLILLNLSFRHINNKVYKKRFTYVMIYFTYFIGLIFTGSLSVISYLKLLKFDISIYNISYLYLIMLFAFCFDLLLINFKEKLYEYYK